MIECVFGLENPRVIRLDMIAVTTLQALHVPWMINTRLLPWRNFKSISLFANVSIAVLLVILKKKP